MPARKSRNSRQQPMQDSIVNLVANLGTPRDKAAHSVYVAGFMPPNQLMDAYRASWLSKAIIDYPAEDATRKWRKWRAAAAQITRIERLEKKLHVAERVQDALVSARLFGGAAIYINVDGQDQDNPLEPAAGKDIKSLVVLPRSSLTPSEIVRDIQNPYYGRPEYYTLTSTGDGKNVEIHASRLVIFIGATVPGDISYAASFNQGWGDSVLQSTLETIKQVDSTMANMASLVFEAKVDVFKFQGFAELLAQEPNASTLTRRLMAQAAMKGINGAVVIDGEDDYQQKSATFAGLPDVVTKFMDSVAGASRIPVTRLYGRAAVGLSGSGDGDERVYFDRIGHMQASEISPALEVLDELLIWQALGNRPEEIYYQWAPLRQLSESERADVFAKTATAARAIAGATAGELIGMDALSEALANEFIEQGTLPGLERAIKKFGDLHGQKLPPETGEEQ